MKFCPRRSSGFTLVEVLTVMTILGVLLTIGIARYNDFNRRQILTQAVANLKSDLRLAQDKILAGEKDCSTCQGADGVCGNADDLRIDGWYLRFTSNQSYRIYGSCGGTPFSTRITDLASKGVLVISPATPFSILFRPLGQGVVGATSITLRGPAGNEVAVEITSSGGIK